MGEPINANDRMEWTRNGRNKDNGSEWNEWKEWNGWPGPEGKGMTTGSQDKWTRWNGPETALTMDIGNGTDAATAV